MQVQESDDMSSGVLIFEFHALEPFAEADHDHLRSGLMDGFDGRSNFVGIGLVFDAIGDMVGDGGCDHIHATASSASHRWGGGAFGH